MFCTDIPQPASDHDGLVIASQNTIHFLFKGPEISADIRATKFVIKSCTADRRINHDIQRGRNAVWLTLVHLPGLF